MAQATFVNIPVNAILAVLDKAGFSEISLTGGRYPVYERVFARQHGTHKNVQIRVYTSIDVRSGAVRGDSEDRIMVCAFYTAGTKGGQDRSSSTRFLFSATGVNRASGLGDTPEAVTSIMDRLLGRMREVYAKANKVHTCPKCKEPVKFSRSKKRSINRNGQRVDNPNYNRPYVACMSESCGQFKWDVEEPKAKNNPKSVVKEVPQDIADHQTAANVERAQEQAAFKADDKAIDIMDYYNKRHAG